MADEDFKLLDKDEDEESGESPAKYRLPFALCKRYGIELPDWATPRDAWNALKGRGISPEREYEAMKEKRESSRRSRERAKEKKKLIEAQMKNPEHIPDVNYTHKDGYIAGAKKGKPMSFEQADGGAPNPNFENTNLIGYRTNCQTCVVAYEARLRGYDVRALPNLRNPAIKKLSYETSLAYVGAKKISKPKGQNKVKFLRSNIRDGERFTLEFKWQGKQKAHIISVTMQNGALFAYDPQNGRKYNEKQLGSFMSRKTENEKIMRVDNVEFDYSMVDRILKQSGGKKK